MNAEITVDLIADLRSRVARGDALRFRVTDTIAHGLQVVVGRRNVTYFAINRDGSSQRTERLGSASYMAPEQARAEHHELLRRRAARVVPVQPRADDVTASRARRDQIAAIVARRATVGRPRRAYSGLERARAVIRGKMPDECGDKIRRRDMHLFSKFKIIQEDWDAIFALQSRACACCGSTSPGSAKGWATDHDHDTGEIRGIVCYPCNLVIGMLGDRAIAVRDRTRQILAYLAD